MTAIEGIQDVIAAAAERVGPAVVGLGRGWGRGSGVVVSEGHVLTAAHNLRGEEASVVFSDGRRATASLAAADPDLDLAVLRADTGGLAPVELDAAPPVLGTPVVALANPGGRGLRVTLGTVSTAPTRVRGPRGRRIPGAIEHTAPLPRGSSGGPLVDAAGRLLGLNAIRLEGGLILAVPTDRARVEQLARGEAPARRRLGVAVAPPRVARRMRGAVGLPERDGLLVRAVKDGSPADRAGVRPGDLIVSAGGREVDGVDALHAALDAAEGTLPLVVVRGSEEEKLEATFEEA